MTAQPAQGTDLIGAVVVRKDTAGVVTATYERTPRPHPGSDELLVIPAFVGICGSDMEVLHGRMPESFLINYPHIMGHEWSGVVAAVGAEVTDFAVGDRVLGHGHLGGNEWFGVTHDGAMADEFVVPARMCFPVPEGVSLKSAAMIEPFACVYTALKKVGGTSAAETVHVFGLGAIGLSAVVQAHVAGATVVAFDPSELRRDLALQLGATAALDPLDPTPIGIRAEAAVGRALADLTIEASGVPSAQAMAVESADDEGRVLFMGISPPRPVPISIGLVQQRNLTIVSSTGAPSTSWEPAIRFVATAGIDLTPFVSSVLPLEAAEEAIERAQRPGQEIKVLMRPGSAERAS